MFNNLSVGSLGSTTVYDDTLSKRKLQTVQSARGTNEQYKLLNLTELFEIYQRNGNEYKSFDFIITFKWNGYDKTIGKIYENITSTVVRPILFYAFFDVLFKFNMANIFTNNIDFTDRITILN